MKTLKDYNQEFIDKMGNAINSVNVLEEDAGYVIKFWNTAIKQILEDVKPEISCPLMRGSVRGYIRCLTDLQSNIKQILGE
jgi:hypothetical protein